MNPTMSDLENGSAFEQIESIPHDAVHAWVRQRLYRRGVITAAYWSRNAAVLAAVIAIWRQSSLGILEAFPTICGGAGLGFLLLLPIHELVHAATYRALGARGLTVRYEPRRLTAFCIAPGQVLSARQFLLVCLAPLFVLNLLLVLLLLLVPAGTPRLLVAGALLLHTGACSGDIAFVQYLWSQRPARLFTFDDPAKLLTHFFRVRPSLS